MRHSTCATVAWHMLVHDPTRLALSLVGVAFATLNLFVATGFLSAMIESQAKLAGILDADLVVLNHRTRSVNYFQDVNRRVLHRLAGLDEVAEVVPVIEGDVRVTNPEDGMSRTISYLAFPPVGQPFRFPGTEDCYEKLKRPAGMIFDSKSRSIYGALRSGMSVEVDEFNLSIVETVPMGPNFVKHGHVFMSSATLEGTLHKLQHDMISFGLLRLKPGADVESARVKFKAILSPDVLLLTPEEVQDRELSFTLFERPIGILMGVACLVGFLVGVIICYQVLYNEIADHLGQYATLKALGFPASALIRIVLVEAALLSTLGFLPGLLVSEVVFYLIELQSGIPVHLSPVTMVFLFLSTILMCVLAGTLALDRVLGADPATLY